MIGGIQNIQESQQNDEASLEEGASLSRLERELHASFYASRRTKSNFDHELLPKLKAFCGSTDFSRRRLEKDILEEESEEDEEKEEETVTPLVIVGPPGCGKSTLLAAWLERRSREIQNLPAELRVNEFRFVHVVGCTRSSVLVRELLTRLTTELMTHFDLPRPTVFEPSKLAWDLPRLLKIAGAKGRVLIVIDGLHRLRNDTGAINLKWLPMIFPPNVYVVLSSTCLPMSQADSCHDEDMTKDEYEDDHATNTNDIIQAHEKKHKHHSSMEDKIKKRMLFELQRRNWRLEHMDSLSSSVRKSVLDTLLITEDSLIANDRKHASNQNESEYEQLLRHDEFSMISEADKYELKGLELCAEHHRALGLVRTNALMLATFLRALSCSAARGFDVWRLHDTWLRAATINHDEHADDVAAPLLDAVLQTWEDGHRRTATDQERAVSKSKVAGAPVGRRPSRVSFTTEATAFLPTLVQTKEQDEDDDDDDDYGEDDFEPESPKAQKLSAPTRQHVEEVYDEEEEQLPIYLLGGVESVPGLGALLGDALAFLYVARYGLREEELWALLRELEVDRNREARALAEATAADANGIMSSVGSFSEETSVSEEDESLDLTALAEVPRLLRAVGVIHDADARVLVLPLESEALRSVVRRRYIEDGPMKSPANSKEDEGFAGGDKWHARLAAYFAREQPSRRRAEELPWHLKHCRQWSSLCETISNIPTFETMYHGSPQMKLELQAYWRLLALGPLWLTRKAADQAVLDGVQSSSSAKQEQLLQHLDQALTKGELRSIRSRRDRLQNQAAVFDVVFAFNASVETWLASDKPSSARIAEVLKDISIFLLEFSERVADSSPHFLRSGLNWNRLGELGVHNRVADAALCGPSSPASATATSGRHCLVPDSKGTPLLLQAAASVDGNDPTSTNGNARSSKRSGENTTVIASMDALLHKLKGADGAVSPDARSATRSSASSALYYYERWLWVQFPWIALARAASISWAVGVMNSSTGIAQTNELNRRSSMDTNSAAVEGLELAPGRRAADAATAAVVHCEVGDRRYWRVKKQDPDSTPAIRVSEQRVRARVSCGANGSTRTDSGVEALRRDVYSMLSLQNTTLALDDEDDTEDDGLVLPAPTSGSTLFHSPTGILARGSAAGNGSKVLASGGLHAASTHSFIASKARRTRWKPVVDGPFSASTLKSQRAGTRFPSACALYDAAVLRRTEDSTHEQKQRAATRFGGVCEPASLKEATALRELEAVEASLATDSRDVAALPAHAAIFPTTTAEKKMAQANGRLTKLRASYDALVSERQARKAKLKQAHEYLNSRRTVDKHCSDQLRCGEQLLNTLDQRLESLRVALAESAALGSFHGDILKAAAAARPCHGKQRIQVVEQQLELARVQTEELLTKRRQLLNTSEDLRASGIPQLKRDKRKWTSMRQVAVDRMRLLDASLRANRATVGCDEEQQDRNFLRSRQIFITQQQQHSTCGTTSSPTHAGSGDKDSAARPSTRRPRSRAISSARSNEEKDGELLQEQESLLDQLKVAVGSVRPEEVVAKYKSIKELHDSLSEQYEDHAKRQIALRHGLDVATRELKNLRISGGKADRDKEDSSARRIDVRLFQREIQLQQNQRRAKQTGLAVSSVCSGILHLAKLVEAYNDKETIIELEPDMLAAVERQADVAANDESHNTVDIMCQLVAKCEESVYKVLQKIEKLDQEALDKKPKPPKPFDPSSVTNWNLLKNSEKSHATLTNQINDQDLRFEPHVTAAQLVRVSTLRSHEQNVEISLKAAQERSADIVERVEEDDDEPEPDEKSTTVFLHEGLNTDTAHAALRRANMASKLKQGPRAPMGLAMHQALELVPDSASQNLQRAAAAKKKIAKHRGPLAHTTHTREELKLAAIKKTNEAQIAAQQQQQRRLSKLGITSTKSVKAAPNEAASGDTVSPRGTLTSLPSD